MAQQAKSKGKTKSNGERPKPRPKAGVALSDQDQTVLMAMNLYAEARGEYKKHGTKPLYAVAQVVMNRVASSAWDGNPADVITQAKQFSWTRGTSDPNYAEAYDPSDDDAWRACLKVAKEALAGTATNPVAGADHYHADYTTASWVDDDKIVATIGKHIFYDLKNDDNQARGLADGPSAGEGATGKWTTAPALTQVRSGKATLRKGHKGQSVKTVQGLLKISADGAFGKGTAKEVQQWRATHNLPKGSAVDRKMLAALEGTGGSWKDYIKDDRKEGAPLTFLGRTIHPQNKSNAPSGKLPTPVKPVTKKPVPPKENEKTTWTQSPSLADVLAGKAVMGRWHRGKPVAEVQKMLGMKADGYFGLDTIAEVIVWRKQHFFPGSNKVDSAMLKYLQHDAKLSAEAEAARWQAAPTEDEFKAGGVLQCGMQGECVKKLQVVVGAPSTGKYDEKTVEKVIAFKRTNGFYPADTVTFEELTQFEAIWRENSKVSVNAAAQMAALLNAARASDGVRPGGKCYKAVKDYMMKTGYGKMAVGKCRSMIPMKYQHMAHQFHDYMQTEEGPEKLGLKQIPATTPFDAPPGSLVVVAAGSPGTSHPTAGDITIAAGDGKFYNDGTMRYRGKKSWPPAKGGLLGVYVPDID